MAAENMRKVETMRRKTLEKLRNRWYLVALRVIIDSVDLAEPDRRSTIATDVSLAACKGIVNIAHLLQLSNLPCERERCRVRITGLPSLRPSMYFKLTLPITISNHG